MRWRWIVPSFATAIVFSTSLASGARAQSPAVLGRDDAAFARELYRRNYTDLAEKLVEVISKSATISPEAQIGIKALHLDLRLDLAKSETDLLMRKDKIKTILQEKEDLIHQYPASKEAEDTSNTLPDVYRVLGETITAAIQKEKDVGLVAQLQNEGQQFYAKAEDQLQARLEALRDDHADPDLERQYTALLYNLPRTYYYHSLLFPAGEWKKKELLEKAILGFQQFGLDYSNTLLNYEGLIFMGLCDKDLGNTTDALKDFDDAIALVEFFDVDAKGVYQLSPEAADTVSQAVLQKVLMQTELKDHAGAVATAEKFFKTIEGPYDTRRGLAALAAMAEAQLAAGDQKGANESALKLVEVDERGPWGSKGREIQKRLLTDGVGTIDASNMLKIAASTAGRGDTEGALQICRQAIAAARGTDKEPVVTVDGYILIGSIFLQRQPPWNFEAALAFDAAVEKHASSEKAPEAVYQAMLAYLRLDGEDKRPWFKKRAEERRKTLSTRFPNHPRAAYAQLADGAQLEKEQKYLEAAELYQKIAPGAASFLDAQFRAGNAYFLLARKLCLEKREGEAGKHVSQAETLLKKAQAELEAAAKATMDLEAQARYDGTAFQARMALAQMYLLDCVNRPADVLEVLKGVEDRYASDADRMAHAWGQRISAYEKMGKIDDAVALLDSLVKKDPDSRAIGSAAGQVARALDKRADDLLKQGKAREADEQWKRAGSYYGMSGRALVKLGTARSSDIDTIAVRLFSLGLRFNEVPEGQDSFVGWPAGKTRETNLWKQAAELFEAALQLSPSYKNTILLGRTNGFLRDWPEAAAAYGRLFDADPIYDAENNKFNNSLLRSKPELYQAYLEWGVSEAEAGMKEQDPDRAERFARAQTIFANLVRVPDSSSKVYWHAKYQQIRLQIETGKYQDAKFQMNDIERNNSELGAPAGLQADFKALKETLDKKVF